MRFREFYDRVTEGMALSELWDQFKSDARSSYRLYAEDVDWEGLKQVPAWRRFFKVAAAFAWAMLMHLSAARRVLLLISLLLFLAGISPMERNQPSTAIYGALGLVMVLALELADRVIMKRDLEIAREIQKWLVPEFPPRLDNLEVAFFTRPANTVGGDFYDVLIPKNMPEFPGILLTVADVAGKSVPAAILMATFQASLRTQMISGPSLELLASVLNLTVCERSQGGRRFTTAFLASASLDGKRLEYINAGHNYPILVRNGGEVERLKEGALPFGIQPGADYRVHEVALSRGDLLFVFTDGVVEAVNSAGEEFGDGRLLSLASALGRLGAEDVSRRVRASLDEYVGKTRQHDDMTWLVLKVL